MAAELRRNNTKRTLEKAVRVAALVALAGALAAYGVAVALAGGPLWGPPLFWLAFGLLALLPGLFLCRRFMPGLGGAGLLPVAAAAGLFVLVLGYVGFGALGLVWLSAVPSLVLCALALGGALKTRKAGGGVLARARALYAAVPTGLWLLLLLFALLLFFYCFTGILPYTQPARAGNMTYSHDHLWSIGNTAAVRYGFPMRDLRAYTGVMHYHFFAEAAAGLLGMYSFQSAWNVVTQQAWPVWTGLLLLALWSVGRRLGAGPYLALLPALGATLLHYTFRDYILHVFVNMNNLVQGNLFLCCALLVLLQAEKENFQKPAGLVLFFTSVGALLWTKSTVGMLLLLAMLAAWPAYLFFGRKSRAARFQNRAESRRAKLWPLAAVGIGGAVLLVLYVTLYSGATNRLELVLTPAGLLEAWATLRYRYWPVALLYLLMLPVNLYSFPKFKYTDFVINAMIAGGLVAVCIFDHYSASEQYFLLVAMFLMWFSILRALRVALRFKWLAALPAALCAVAFAGQMVFLAPYLYEGALVGLRVLGLRETLPRAEESITPYDEEAARWIAENVAMDEVFAVNRNSKILAMGDGVFHYYTATSERQAYVECWLYAHHYSMPGGLVRYNLLYVSEDIYRMARLDETYALAREEGIDYLVVYRPLREAPFEGGTPVFENEEYWIYEIPEGV